MHLDKNRHRRLQTLYPTLRCVEFCPRIFAVYPLFVHSGQTRNERGYFFKALDMVKHPGKRIYIVEFFFAWMLFGPCRFLMIKSLDTAFQPNALRESKNCIFLKRPFGFPLLDQAFVELFKIFASLTRQNQIPSECAVLERIFMASRLSLHFAFFPQHTGLGCSRLGTLMLIQGASISRLRLFFSYSHADARRLLALSRRS